MGKVVCFGEIMLRLSPPGYQRIIQAKSFGITFGGAEANVAVSLSNYGIPSTYVTKLPESLLGDACRNELRKHGVDVSSIARGGNRLGIYYCENGAAMRPANVIYDRAGSSFAEAKPEDYNWDVLLDCVVWFHFTGITPALGDSMAAIVEEACKKAKSKGITISCDLNYRKKLWSREKASRVMGALMPYVDLLIANEEDAADVFGIRAEGSDVSSGRLSGEGYKQVAEMLVQRFGMKYTAITLRESISASDNGWSGLLYDGSVFYTSKHYSVHIVDRVGAGDAFGAGLIYGLNQGLGMQETLEFAVAASAMKQTIEGDFNMVTLKEVQALAGGDASGRVQR
jgi:2-dehydro-3-deoxygluconokinase